MMKYIKEKEWLREQLGTASICVIDCRFQLGSPDAGREAYEQDHIPGAVYLDLEKELSGKVQSHGGRHPLPDLLVFKAVIEKAGIDNKKPVIVYDGGEGCFAARCWWMLTYVGHPSVFILDGGYQEWKNANFPITTEIPNPQAVSFKINVQSTMLANFDLVKKVTEVGGAALIDSRARERFLGLEEPIDRIPGHIPTSCNIVWMEAIEGGKWKNVELQAQRFAAFSKTEPIIVYCGSGVSAAPNVLALKAAGYENVKLYIGSYSDWISYEENPVETGE